MPIRWRSQTTHWPSLTAELMSPTRAGGESRPSSAATQPPGVRMDELGAASPGTESRGCAGWLIRHQPEIQPLRGRFGWQKKWIKNSGWSLSYLLMPSLRTVLHCSSRKSLFDTFIYWLVLLKGKANEASDKDILDTNVEMPCQVWAENQCSSTSRPLSGSSASEFYEPSIWSGNARSRHSQQQAMACTRIKNTFPEILPGRQRSWSWF